MNERVTRNGFTLMETLVAVSLTVALLAILASVLSGTFRSFSAVTSVGQLQLSGRAGFQRMVRQIEQAKSVTLSQGAFTTSASTLVVQLPALANDQTIIANVYDYAIYTLDATDPSKLRETIVADAASTRQSKTQTIIANVELLLIKYYDVSGNELVNNYTNTKRVKITVTASETHYKRKNTLTYNEFVSLRNK